MYNAHEALKIPEKILQSVEMYTNENNAVEMQIILIYYAKIFPALCVGGGEKYIT